MINVMDEYVSFNKKCFHNYLKYILQSEYNRKICDELIEAYMNVRYTNYLDEKSKSLPLDKKIEKSLDLAAERLLNDIPPKFETAVKNSRYFSQYIIEFDQLYLLEAQKRAAEKIYEDCTNIYEEPRKNLVKDLNDLLMIDTKKRKDFLLSFESPTFNIEYAKINNKELQANIKYNITFPELYSEVAIKKVAEKDNVAEDLTVIALLQLAANIINDIACCDFEKKYFINLPTSVFEKKIKVSRLFTIVDSIYFQDKIRFIITFDCLCRCKSSVREYMRQGFVFGLLLDDTFDYSTQNTEFLELFDKIFISPDKYYYKDMKNSGKIKDRIVNIAEVK